MRPGLQVRDAGTESGRVLLRPGVHVRSGLPVPGVVRMPEREEEVSTMVIETLAAERERYLAFVRHRVRSGADAEDLLQKALVRAMERADQLNDPSRASAWFYRILRNTIADHHAEWARQNAKLHVLAADVEEAEPEDVAMCACSLGLMGDMRQDYRDVIQRVDVDGESIDDVSKTLGITTNNATVRLHRARQALKTAVVDHCGTTSVAPCDCDC
jgi:RNA polymerase sigma-70 factor (ECF subfamily)